MNTANRRHLIALTTAAMIGLGGASAVTAANAATPTPASPSTTSNPTSGGDNAQSANQPLPTSPSAYNYGAQLATLQGTSLEITFLAGIIPHHQSAITMAKLELSKGRDADLRTHADNIIADQQHQIDQFTTWLKQWYDLTPEQAMAKTSPDARRLLQQQDSETQQRIAQLQYTQGGSGFDVAFVKAIIPHHSSGIIEFLEPQSRAVHPALRVAASNGVTTQQAEIADFRTWLGAKTGS